GFRVFGAGTVRGDGRVIEPSIFKSYDIRGIYPTQLDEAGAEAIARAFAQVTQAHRVVVGKDVRASGPALAQSAIAALRAAGVDVVDIGTVSTDMFYFAVATLDVDGGFTISASHNPKEWNGFNCCRRGAVPLSLTSGLDQIRDLALADRGPAQGGKLGSYEEPDGAFPVPGGVPNPLLPANQGELVQTVRSQGADLGVAWDADGDRCFFVDETGYFLSGYFTTAILARSILHHTPGATVVIDPRSIWATQETIAALGGKTVLSRAGMTIIPARMREVNAA